MTTKQTIMEHQPVILPINASSGAKLRASLSGLWSSDVTRKLSTTTLAKMFQFVGLFAANLILANLLVVEDFGRYRMLLSVVTTTVTLAALGIPVTAKNMFADLSTTRDESNCWITCSLFVLPLALAGGLVAAIVCLLFGQLDLSLAVFGLLVLPMSFSALINNALVGSGRLHQMAMFEISRTGLFLLLLSALAFWGGLTVRGALFSQFLSYLPLMVFLVPPVLQFEGKQIRILASQVYRQVRKFGLYVYTGSIFAVASKQVSVALIGVLASVELAGVIALALTLLMPLEFVALNLGDIRYREMRQRKSASVKDFRLVIVVMGLASGGYILLTPVLLSLFPHGYSDGVFVAGLVAVTMPLRGIGYLYNRSLLANGSGRKLLGASIGIGISYVVILLVGIKLFDTVGVVLALTAYNVAILVFHWMAWRFKFPFSGKGNPV